MKNLIVNAQVTAMVSFFEVAGILVVILVNVIAPQYNCASVVLFQLLENIILPYFFIVNTRKNKDKIVEQGWKNVFQNSSILHNLSLPYTQSIDVISINDKLETHKNDIYIISKRFSNRSCTESEPESFNMKIMECNLNIPDVHEKPSTSIINTLNHHGNLGSNVRCASTDSSIDMDDSKLHVIDKRLKMSEKLLKFIKEEAMYIRLFSQFVFLEDCGYKEKYSVPAEDIDHDIIQQRMMKLTTGDNGLNRYLMRREMLEKLKDRKHEERIYQNILQEFIDMEEHILEDEKS